MMISLKNRARLSGLVYVAMSAVTIPALLFLPRYIVEDNPAATAQKIAEHLPTYRLMLLGDLAGSVLFVVLAWSLYHLFEGVGRRLAALMFAIVVVSATLGMLDVILLSAPLIFHSNAAFLAAFAPVQRDALSYAMLKLQRYEQSANEVLWGVWLVPFGVLIIRSRFIPRVIGVSLLVASVGYIAMGASFIGFPDAVPAVDRIATRLIQFETPIILWLVVFGAWIRKPAMRPAGSSNLNETVIPTSS